MKLRSINLLPQERLAFLHIERMNAVATAAAVLVAVVLGVVSIGLILLIGGTVAIRGSLDGQITQTKGQVSALDKLDGGGSLEQQTKVLQDQLAVIRTILSTKDQVQFGRALVRLSQIVPPDVSFNQATIDASHTVTVSGEAKSYASVGRFAEALKSDGSVINRPVGTSTSYFHDVQVTSTVLGSGAKVTYSITFTLGQETFNAGN